MDFLRLETMGEPMIRSHSFGQNQAVSLVDRFGIWLSQRSIKRWIEPWDGKRIADLGCGFYARIGMSLLPRASSLTLVDVSLDPDLKDKSSILTFEGDLSVIVESMKDKTFDIIILINVLEHMSRGSVPPFLHHLHRILDEGGILLINVPSWRGKRFLEFSAFRLGTSPVYEMDDHKMYYDVPNLWPLCVEAGFLPSKIKCFHHKFGINTLAVCYR